MLRTTSTVQVADYPVAATFGPRTLSDYEFVWVLQGSAVWSVHTPSRAAAGPTGPVLLAPGTLSLARSGTVDSYRWDERRPSQHAYVHFGIEDRGDLPGEEEWPATRSFGEAPVLEGLCTYLLDLAGQQSDRARTRSDQVLHLLLAVFLTGPLGPPARLLPPVVAAVTGHVRRSWAVDGLRAIDTAELAAAARVSAGHLHRVFRQQYGCGPVHALERVRLARAAVHLQRSNESIAEIAARVGFTDPYHFSRRFRTLYGSPPGRYRQMPGGADPVGPLRDAGLLPLAHVLASPPEPDTSEG